MNKRAPKPDKALVLTGLTLVGILLVLTSYLPFSPPWKTHLPRFGFLLFCLATGLPATLRAAKNLWERRILDIDILMVLAALAVRAPLEGAIVLTLFSISTTLEERAMGKAKRSIEALMALRPQTA